VRTIGLFQILAGVGVGLLGFLVDAEPPGSPESDHWGGTYGIVLLAVSLCALIAIVGSVLRKRRR
jgi:hypothetical protein